MTYPAMLKAFGAQAKYQGVQELPESNWEELRAKIKAIHNYKRDLLEFATEWDKSNPVSDGHWTCRDRYMTIEGAQMYMREYQCLGGKLSFEQLKESLARCSDRDCIPYDIVVCG